MSILTWLFLALLAVGGIFPLCIGLLTIFYWIKAPRPPADDSNRLNNIASWWIGLTRTEVMARSYEYFRQDIMDNVIDVKLSNIDTEVSDE